MNLLHVSRLPRLIYFFLFILGFTLPFSMLPRTTEGTAGMHIYVNDQALTMDQPPTQIEGRVMVPFRVLFTALGGSVDWNPETEMVTGRLKETIVSLQLETGIAVVNQQIVSLDVGARVINGRTMVPLRFVSENLGAAVHYDDDSGTVRISLKPVEGVFLDKRNLILEPGGSATLKANVIPQDAANRKVKWFSSDPRVARVNMISETEAVVTPISGGTSIIFAETDDRGFIDTCYVEVKGKDMAVTGFSLSRTSITLSEGQAPTTIRAMLRPDDATNQKVTWSSSTTSVATVHQSGINEGMITPMQEGETIITAKTEDGGFEAICRVIVEKYAIPVQSIYLSHATRTLEVGGDYEMLAATLTPRYASNQNITWRVEKDGKDVKGAYVAIEIDSRSDGYERVRLLPVKAGTVRIIATTGDGNFSASCRVVVNP